MELVLVVLVVLLILGAAGAMPRWPYSSSWGWYPSSLIGIVLLILLLLILLGKVPHGPIR